MAPVVRALRSTQEHEVILCSTGQHKEMLASALGDFGLSVDHDLEAMTPNQSLAGLTSKLVTLLDSFLEQIKPDWVLVQGDTTTVLAASLCSYYRNLRVAHVEAGLRSGNKSAPFPEEINRKIASVVADLHFAPTETAQSNLLAEGIPAASIHVTGNTVIDALLWMREQVRANPSFSPEWLRGAVKEKKRIILVTCHRRESFGQPLRSIFTALKTIALNNPDCLLVLPMHLNPNVSEVARTLLNGLPNVVLCAPLSYREFVSVLDHSYLVLTDSGGVQEEAPAFLKPVLVMRAVTERPEGVVAGLAKLVGTDTEQIVGSTQRLLDSHEDYEAMRQAPNPYGDGTASIRIQKALYGKQ
jgi:UDP-N-acetylglucosamine 2-epimerase